MARLGTPDPRDYLLGRGELYFSDDLDANGAPKGFRHLGNTEALTVNVESEELEHFSTLLGLKTVDRSVVISQSMGVGFQLAEIDSDNLKLFLAGERASNAVVGASIATAAGDDNVVVAGLDKWYDLYDVQNPSAYPPVPGDNAERVYKISAVSVLDTTKVTTYVEGTDYEVDYDMGRIKPLSTGSIGATDALCVDFTYASYTIEEVRGLKTAKLNGVLKFVSINANDDDKKREYQFHSVTLRAEGDFGLIGDEFATLNVQGKAGQNATVSPDSPTLTVREIVV